MKDHKEKKYKPDFRKKQIRRVVAILFYLFVSVGVPGYLLALSATVISSQSVPDCDAEQSGIQMIRPRPLSEQAPDAEAIIEKMSAMYDKWEGMYIAFAANIRSEKNGIAESFEGTIRMKKDKFILQIPEMQIWFDGVTQWTYRQRVGEVNINTPVGNELRDLNPMLLLKDYKKEFHVSYIGESTSANAKTAYDIALIPKKKEDIEKIELQIEKNTSLPAKIVVTMHHDMRSVFTIRTIREESFSDQIFTFPEAEYPDAEHIDLR